MFLFILYPPEIATWWWLCLLEIAGHLAVPLACAYQFASKPAP
jgi:hypothetical protein